MKSLFLGIVFAAAIVLVGMNGIHPQVDHKLPVDMQLFQICQDDGIYAWFSDFLEDGTRLVTVILDWSMDNPTDAGCRRQALLFHRICSISDRILLKVETYGAPFHICTRQNPMTVKHTQLLIEDGSI